MGILLVVKVPVPTMLRVKFVYVLPEDKVIEPAMFNVVAGSVYAVVAKLRLLNQLPVVNVCTETLEPL
jgi:hypothetical protein